MSFSVAGAGNGPAAPVTQQDAEEQARRKSRRSSWSVDSLRTDPAASQAKIGGGRLGEQLSGVILYDVKQDKTGEMTLTGRGHTGPQGRTLEPQIAALLGALLETSGTPNLKIDHIAFSPTGGAHAAMHLATSAADGMLDGWTGADIAQSTQMLQQFGLLGGDYAYYHNTKRGAWLVLGPETTRVLMRLAQGKELNPREARSTLATLRHELQHAVTPSGYSSAAMKIRWVEESTASLLAGWPGHKDASAKALGIDVPPGDMDDMDPYVSGTRVLRQLVQWAGVDVASPGGYARAFELLQGKRLEKVPIALADAIGKQRNLTAPQVRALAEAISNLRGFEPQWKKRLAALARDFKLPLDAKL